MPCQRVEEDAETRLSLSMRALTALRQEACGDEAHVEKPGAH